MLSGIGKFGFVLLKSGSLPQCIEHLNSGLLHNSIALSGLTRLFPLHCPDLFYMLSFIDTVLSFFFIVVCILILRGFSCLVSLRFFFSVFTNHLFLFTFIVLLQLDTLLALKFLPLI